MPSLQRIRPSGVPCSSRSKNARRAHGPPRRPACRPRRPRSPLEVWVDRERARFGAWYELFPRSQSPDARQARHPPRCRASSFRACGIPRLRRHLSPADPPHRHHQPQGKNNSLTAGPHDVGSPVGDRRPGRRPRRHTPRSRHPGRLRRLRQRGQRARHRDRSRLRVPGLPDHPWVIEHPEWFSKRADGTIAYAENPPKKYEDIYPLTSSKTTPRAATRRS
jgi:starch synthase (maltosyl-transferring)